MTPWVGPLITAIAAIFAATVAYVGTLRRNTADAAATQRDHVGEWADRFAASEQRSRDAEEHCRAEMDRLRGLLTVMQTDVASMRGEIVRLEQLVIDLGGDPRHPDMHP